MNEIVFGLKMLIFKFKNKIHNTELKFSCCKSILLWLMVGVTKITLVQKKIFPKYTHSVKRLYEKNNKL